MARAVDARVYFASISFSDSADLVALVAAKKIRVVAMALTLATDQTIKFQSGGATDLTGAMSPGAKNPLVLPMNLHGWFETVAGAKLNVVCGAAVTGAGFMAYQLIGNDADA